MRTTKFTVRMDETLNTELKTLAAERELSVNDAVNEAVKFYRDYHYMQNKATFLGDEILAAMDGMVTGFEQRSINRICQLLSSTAIEIYTLERIVAENLDVTSAQVEDYRAEAVEYLKKNNRIPRFMEML